jgi:hypothetical protein
VVSLLEDLTQIIRAHQERKMKGHPYVIWRTTGILISELDHKLRPREMASNRDTITPLNKHLLKIAEIHSKKSPKAPKMFKSFRILLLKSSLQLVKLKTRTGKDTSKTLNQT